MKVIPVFVDESGALHHSKQPHLLVGMLEVHDVCAMTDALYTACFNFNSRIRQKRKQVQRDIREIHEGNAGLADFQMLLAKTRHHEYKFTGINEENLQDYVSFLNLFFSLPGSAFHAILVERTSAASQYFGKDSWPTYIAVTKTLLERRLKQPSFVLCDWQARPTAQKVRLEDQCCELPNVAGCVRITSETSPFLQVVDLLLGSISFDWRDARGAINPSTSSELKRHLVRFVKDKLHMSPTTRFLAPGSRYFARRTPLVFSAWQPDPCMVKVKMK